MDDVELRRLDTGRQVSAGPSIILPNLPEGTRQNKSRSNKPFVAKASKLKQTVLKDVRSMAWTVAELRH